VATICRRCIAQMLGAVVGTGFAKAIAGAARFDNVFGGANTLATGVSAGQAVFAEVSKPQVSTSSVNLRHRLRDNICIVRVRAW
jgi:hypothetical protein